MGVTARLAVNSIHDDAGVPLIGLAVRAGNEATVKHLLEARADPAKTFGQASDSALMLLSQKRVSADEDRHTLPIAKLLVEAKANINYANIFSQTALYQCAGRHDAGLAEYLLRSKADPNFWCATFQRSLLLEFFEKKAPADQIEMLIEHGAELTGKEREHILHTCAAGNDFAVLKLLVEKAGAGKPHMEARNGRGENTLHIVCQRPVASVKAARLLLLNGVDMELTTVKGLTPLILAIRHNRSPELILYLLDKRADPNHASPANTTPLLEACRAPVGTLGCVRALLQRGANVNHQENVTRHTALHVLAARDDCDVPAAVDAARMILQHGGSPSVRDRDGRIPLHVAYATAGRKVRGQRVPGNLMVRVLLANAGEDDVNTADYRGVVPIKAYEEPEEVYFGAVGGGVAGRAPSPPVPDFEQALPAGRDREAERLSLDGGAGPPDLAEPERYRGLASSRSARFAPAGEGAPRAPATAATSSSVSKIGAYLRDARARAGEEVGRADEPPPPPPREKPAARWAAVEPQPPPMVDEEILASLVRPRRRK
jgi:ankyrin repeat protein